MVLPSSVMPETAGAASPTLSGSPRANAKRNENRDMRGRRERNFMAAGTVAGFRANASGGAGLSMARKRKRLAFRNAGIGLFSRGTVLVAGWSIATARRLGRRFG